MLPRRPLPFLRGQLSRFSRVAWATCALAACVSAACALACSADPENNAVLQGGAEPGSNAPTSGAASAGLSSTGGASATASEATAGGGVGSAVGGAVSAGGLGTSTGASSQTGALSAAGAANQSTAIDTNATAGAGGLGGTGPEVGGASAVSAVSGAGGTSAGGGGGGPPVGDEIGIRVDGRQLLVDGAPFHIRGVCWNPVPAGAGHPEGLDYAGFASVDIPLMQAAGINAVRTYEPLMDAAVLDQFLDAGMYVLNGVYPYGGVEAGVVSERIAGIQDHPAILMWVLGNEWNYNGLYVDLSHADSLARLNEAAAILRAADVSQPIATIYGELPSGDTIDAMPEVEIWGINAYRGIGFGALFSDWQALSDKPMFLAEYGADAYNANLPGYDPDSQAEAVRALTQELLDNSTALSVGGASPISGTTLGGLLFEWADEWWKDGTGSPGAQDVGGIAPGGGPYPDQTFNEEWWGVVDIDRKPRPAYTALVNLYTPL